MKIEIIKRQDNPVTEFFSSTSTPETDAERCEGLIRGNAVPTHVVPVEFAEELERERDEAQKELSSIHRWIERNHADGFIDSLTYFQNLERVTDSWYDRLDRLEVDAVRLERERDEALEQEKIHLDNYIEMKRERDEARAQLRLRPDALSHDAWDNICRRLERERDEAREALMKIEDLFIDGTDIYADRETMGQIARNALEGAK